MAPLEVHFYSCLFFSHPSGLHLLFSSGIKGKRVCPVPLLLGIKTLSPTFSSLVAEEEAGDCGKKQVKKKKNLNKYFKNWKQRPDQNCRPPFPWISNLDQLATTATLFILLICYRVLQFVLYNEVSLSRFYCLIIYPVLIFLSLYIDLFY